MGFGHRVYKAEDPRARHLRDRSQVLGDKMGEPRWYQILRYLEEQVMVPYRSKGIYVNVGLLRRVHIPPPGYTRRPVHTHLRPWTHPRLDPPVRGAVPGQHPPEAPSGVHGPHGPGLCPHRPAGIAPASDAEPIEGAGWPPLSLGRTWAFPGPGLSPDLGFPERGTGNPVLCPRRRINGRGAGNTAAYR